MKNKIILTIFIVSVFSTLLLSTAYAQSTQLVTPGLTKDEILQYSYNATWNSTDPTLQAPAEMADLLQTQSFQITITDVSGTTVNAIVTKTYRNGTTSTEAGFVDVESGSIRLPFGSLIIAGNLNAGARIYPTGGDATINNTVTRTYPSGDRQTNQLITESTSGTHKEKTDIYYDKGKGIAVSSYDENIYTFGSETETFTETITNTNADAWATANTTTATTTATATTTNSPGATTTNEPTKAAFVFSTVDLLTVIAVIVIVLIVVLALYGRRRKPKTQQTQTEYLGTF